MATATVVPSPPNVSKPGRFFGSFESRSPPTKKSGPHPHDKVEHSHTWPRVGVGGGSGSPCHRWSSWSARAPDEAVHMLKNNACFKHAVLTPVLSAPKLGAWGHEALRGGSHLSLLANAPKISALSKNPPKPSCPPPHPLAWSAGPNPIESTGQPLEYAFLSPHLFEIQASAHWPTATERDQRFTELARKLEPESYMLNFESELWLHITTHMVIC